MFGRDCGPMPKQFKVTVPAGHTSQGPLNRTQFLAPYSTFHFNGNNRCTLHLHHVTSDPRSYLFISDCDPHGQPHKAQHSKNNTKKRKTAYTKERNEED
ncbi:hypothetical protein OUZ56_021495 [Daphnia magna]|uniref:Uncharacterized protein n=1 Tax=Daphnia magna TaxID=35525 RepID=A0ABQ9ZHJ7_9CRUS|nr:hypothetical protein OUZ56_021495 [Daphnia magna]